MAGAQNLADTIGKAIQSAIAGATEQEKSTLAQLLNDAASHVKGDPYADVGDFASVVNALLGLLSLVAPEVGLPLELLDKVEQNAGKSGISFGLGYILGTIAYQISGPIIAPLEHIIGNALQTEIFDPQTAATLQAKGIIDDTYGRSEAAGGNLSGEHYDKMVDAAQVRPDTATLNELFNRGLIKDTDIDLALTRNGVPTYWHEPLKQLRMQLLGGPDLALANLRGNIDDATLDAYRQRIGISTDDMQVLIGNTGEPPGPEQLMEALRRGFIDETRFDRGIRQSRVRNEWIDVEKALAFAPMSTADAIRAVVEGYFTSDQGKQIAIQNGLEPAHWDTLVQAWGRPLAHEQMLELYYRGQATLDDVRQAMRESDLKNKYIEQAIELGRRLVPERTIVSMLSHGVIDHPRALSMLKSLGFDEQDAESLISLGAAQHTTQHKTLTRADILTMYTDALLTRKAAQDHLAKLGYNDTDTTAMLDLADYKRKASGLRTVEKGVEASLKAHHITQDQAIVQLTKAGLDALQAKTLVDEWTMQRATPTRTLTESQIIKAVSDKIIDSANGRVRLQALGLADGDVTILYKIHGILPIGG